jgi:hypothetical protein
MEVVQVGALREAIELNGRLVASASVRELLSVVHASHQDFNAVNVATSWHKLAKLARGSRGLQKMSQSQDVANAVVELLVKETPRVVNEMQAQGVGNTLWAFGSLAEKEVELDAAVVRAVSDAALRVAGEMIFQDLSITLWAMSKFAEKGMYVDAAAVRAVSDAAGGVAGEMSAHNVANTLWAMTKLSENGVDVDAAAVRAVSYATANALRKTIDRKTSWVSQDLKKNAQAGVSNTQRFRTNAVSGAAARVAAAPGRPSAAPGIITTQEAINTAVNAAVAAALQNHLGSPVVVRSGMKPKPARVRAGAEIAPCSFFARGGCRDGDGRGVSLAYNRPRVYAPHLSCFKASLLPPKRPRCSAAGCV